MSKAHIGLAGVCALGDQLGGGVTVNCPMELILNRCKELVGDCRVRVVVVAGAVDIRDFAIEVLFRSADLPHALDQFIEIVVPSSAILQALVVQGEPFDYIFPKALRSPYSELCPAMRLNSVTY